MIDFESGTKFISTDLHGGPFLHSEPAKIHASQIFRFNPILPNSTRIKSLARVHLRV